VFIRDFFRVCEHKQEFANLFIADSDERTARMSVGEQLLQSAGGDRLYAALQSLPADARKEAVRESHRKRLNDIRTNRHRLDYPPHIARGCPIGSGMIASGMMHRPARRSWPNA